MIIFDGFKFAEQKEEALSARVRVLSEQGIKLKIAAILFSEDDASRLYTGLKKEAANRVGIGYRVYEFSLQDEFENIIRQINLLNQDKEITGIIIQKPSRSTWKKHNLEFDRWWIELTSKIKLDKDVDGLRSENTKVLPATVKAVLEILKVANISLNNKKILILNRSDILGQPLYKVLKNRGVDVKIWGSKDLHSSTNKCQDFDIIVSGTGRPNLITGDMLKKGAILIDVGEPKGDIDFESVKEKAQFITPVPGGVGPMTVVSLLENSLDLLKISL